MTKICVVHCFQAVASVWESERRVAVLGLGSAKYAKKNLGVPGDPPPFGDENGTQVGDSNVQYRHTNTVYVLYI